MALWTCRARSLRTCWPIWLATRGELDEALAAGSRALEVARRLDDLRSVGQRRSDVRSGSDSAISAISEVRAATSLTRLWLGQGKREDARDLLAPIYNWFTEGSDTPVLKEARAVLEQIDRLSPATRR